MTLQPHKTILALAAFFASLSCAPSIPVAQTTPQATDAQTPAAALPAIKAGETISLEHVIAITRANQPTLMAAKGAIKASRSRIGQAESHYFPQVNAGAGYSRLSPEGNIYGANSDATYDQITSAIGADQLIYDFGKTKTQVEIRKSDLESSQADLNATDNLIIYQATLAYFDLLKAKRNVEVANDTVKQFSEHLDQAKGFFAAGVKPKYDVTKAEVDFSQAKLLQIKTNNSLRLARVALNNAMGLPDAPQYTVEDTLDVEPFTLPFDQAMPIAMKNRPDLKALILKKQSALQSVDLAAKGDSPTLAANAGAAYSGATNNMDEGWHAGVSLSFPIFNGHLTRHQTDEAQANVEIIEANITSLENTIRNQVEQSYLNLNEAEERITTTKLTTEQAEENLRIASGRYSAGVGSPMEVTDANTLLVQAQASYIQSLYDYRVAKTSIEHAIGIIEPPGKDTATPGDPVPNQQTPEPTTTKEQS